MQILSQMNIDASVNIDNSTKSRYTARGVRQHVNDVNVDIFVYVRVGQVKGEAAPNSSYS